MVLPGAVMYNMAASPAIVTAMQACVLAFKPSPCLHPWCAVVLPSISSWQIYAHMAVIIGFRMAEIVAIYFDWVISVSAC